MRVQYAMAGEAGDHGFGAWVKDFWPVIAGIAIATWTVIRSALVGASLSKKAKGELESIARGAVKDSIEILRGENSRLSGRIEDLEADLAATKSNFAATLLSKDGEISLLRGELRGILATALSYQAKLEAAGVPHEKISSHYWDISGFQIKEVEVKTDDR